MLKKPSPVAELEGWLEDRPVEAGRADQRLRLGLRARVVEVRDVLDAHRAHVDEPPDAGRGHRGDDGPRPFGVDQAQVGAAVEVARDRRRGGRRRRRRPGPRPSVVRAGDVADARLDARRGGRAPAGRGPARRRSASGPARRPDDPRPAAPGSMWLPTKPLAPVTRTVDMELGSLPAGPSDRDGRGIVASTPWTTPRPRRPAARRSPRPPCAACSRRCRRPSSTSTSTARSGSTPRSSSRGRAASMRRATGRGMSRGAHRADAVPRPGRAAARVRPADRPHAGRRGARAHHRRAGRDEGRRRRPVRRDPLGTAAPRRGRAVARRRDRGRVRRGRRRGRTGPARSCGSSAPRCARTTPTRTSPWRRPRPASATPG